MQMQREILKQYKILREIYLQQVRIFASQNRASSTLFGYRKRNTYQQEKDEELQKFFVLLY